MRHLRSQAERDKQTVTIASFLAIFVGILLAGVVLGLVINAVSGLSEGAAAVRTIGTLLLAATVSLTFLLRHRRS